MFFIDEEMEEREVKRKSHEKISELSITGETACVLTHCLRAYRMVVLSKKMHVLCTNLHSVSGGMDL